MAEYIEREAALQVVADIMGDCKVGHKHRAINRNIKQIPAADVVEVRRGRFVDEVGNPVESFDYCGRASDKSGRALYRPIYCSECHMCLAGMNDKLYPYRRNYCSSCGAKMDGKGDNDG